MRIVHILGQLQRVHEHDDGGLEDKNKNKYWTIIFT